MPELDNKHVVFAVVYSILLVAGLNQQSLAFDYQVPPFSGSTDVVKVFQGAEGFGTDTAAGRGGGICFVENLEDSGAGSLRSCVGGIEDRN